MRGVIKIKKFIYVLVAILCIGSFHGVVYAEEVTSSIPYVTSGYFDSSKINENRMYTCGYSCNNTLSVAGDGYLYIVFYSYNDGSAGEYHLRGKGIVTQDKYERYEYTNVDSANAYGIVDGQIDEKWNTYVYEWDGGADSWLQICNNVDGLSLCDTNIPIFSSDDLDAISNYLENGDKSGAMNSTNFVDEESSDIPLPHNLQVVSGTNQHVTTTLGDDVIDMYPLTFSRDIVITWTQEDVVDGLTYDVETRLTTVHINDASIDEATGNPKSEVGENTTAYYPICSSAYSGKNTITMTISKDTLNTFKTNGLLKSAQIRVRNKSSGKTSKWVLVTLDFVNKTATATEQGYIDAEDTGGEEYNDTPASNNGQLIDKITDGTTNVSLSGVMTFIRDGFGLLGNGGIIALLSSTFVYLPNSIWIMLKFLVAMMIAVSIIKLVKDVIT